VDKEGVAVALTFLIVVALLAGGPGEKTAGNHERQEPPDRSLQIEIRPVSKVSLESGTAAPTQQLTGLKQELEDPRRGN